jgi:hypothetical protein
VLHPLVQAILDKGKAYVHIVQNPYAWLLSMYNWPVDMSRKVGWRERCDFPCFIARAYTRRTTDANGVVRLREQAESLMQLRANTLHNHLGLASKVPRFASVQYEHLTATNGDVNEEALGSIGRALGLGDKLVASSQPVPYYSHSTVQQVWEPWKVPHEIMVK